MSVAVTSIVGREHMNGIQIIFVCLCHGCRTRRGLLKVIAIGRHSVLIDCFFILLD